MCASLRAAIDALPATTPLVLQVGARRDTELSGDGARLGPSAKPGPGIRMLLDETGHGIANDVHTNVIFAGPVEGTLRKFCGKSFSTQLSGNFGVRKNDHAAAEGIFEVGNLPVLFHLETAVGD